ncbi:glycosyltransferase [Nostoc sp. 'Peltigera malacea cyanobiont' DB3992]|uniref:glycosyltransferase n=1 Tax=Nostoc sp. 'Peltigera malacea cyanobiont' DB3992 TaxID=1206980 RepID=UPI000C048448|nr:glycosyltransferase [Nostoc sp. 'Peltigera malacea cyanobiont' DB3992]PHM11370.1 glycosyl transferase [Nostoc sp. 'Peltigera malacea cyanobiont' DB3992]
MTLISKLGYKPTKKANLIAPLKVISSDISIVIPVNNNQKGIDLFLSIFFNTHGSKIYPREIIIVDNNSNKPITIHKKFQINGLEIILLKCSKIGPASARNLGLSCSKGDWILFTDSDCIPCESWITGYIDSMNGSIGYAGNVKAWGGDFLSKYYETQEILVPLKVIYNETNISPEYLITANALIWKPAIEKIGGFNEDINIAAGEDIDLGWRLLELGNLSYAFNSLVFHNFDDGILGFVRRFSRYGKGNKVISKIYNIDLSPQRFNPNRRSFINQLLSKLQYICLLWGYITH